MDRRHAVVTGGGAGIGLAIAQALHGAGHAVTIMGRDEARLNRALEGLPGAVAVACDVTSDESVAAAFARASERSGPVGILVNNAGGATSAPFERTTAAAWAQSLDLNLMSCVRTTREALPAMKSAGWGRVVNVASTAGLKGYAYVSAYVAAKHAVVGLTRALALELARTGITVNAVCPGYTDTDLVGRAVDTIAQKTGRSPESARADLASVNPQGRLVRPDEVASAVLWLVSDAATAVNGAAIPISGGEV